MTRKRLDLKRGMRFGHLTLLGENDRRRTNYGQLKIYEKCICDCGNEVFISRASLSKGTKSCGCLQKETASKTNSTHGMRLTRIYRIYTGIKTRCNNVNEKTYKNYGARGIKCEWNSFEEFYKDMGDSYNEHIKEYGEKDTTIERINVNGNYCKENCTRKTKKEQVNNQRSNTICIINGEQHNLGEWSKILGIPRETLKRYLVKGKIKGQIFRRGTGTVYPYKEFGWN